MACKLSILQNGKEKKMDNDILTETECLVWDVMHCGEHILPRIWEVDNLIRYILLLNLSLTPEDVLNSIYRLQSMRIITTSFGDKNKIHLVDKRFRFLLGR